LSRRESSGQLSAAPSPFRPAFPLRQGQAPRQRRAPISYGAAAAASKSPGMSSPRVCGRISRPLSPLALHQAVELLAAAASRLRCRGDRRPAGRRRPHRFRPTSQGHRGCPAHHHPSRRFDRQAGRAPPPTGPHRRWRFTEFRRPASPRRRAPVGRALKSRSPGCLPGVRPGHQRFQARPKPADRRLLPQPASRVLTDRNRTAPLTRPTIRWAQLRIASSWATAAPLRAILATGQPHVDDHQRSTALRPPRRFGHRPPR